MKRRLANKIRHYKVFFPKRLTTRRYGCLSMKMDGGALASQTKTIIQVTSWTIGEEFTCTLVAIVTARSFTVVVMMCGIQVYCIT